MAKRRRFKHLTKSDRLIIERMEKQHFKKREIADAIGTSIGTIFRELKRGRYTKLNSDYTEEECYSPDIAHQRYRDNLKAKGPDLKIGHDHELANYIEDKILNDGYSPEAVLGEIKAKGLQFNTTISKTTLYRYIDIGLFASLSNKELPVKGRRKKRKKKIHRNKQARASAGESIERRPDHILNREEFGHWEMDTVVGKQKQSKHSLLVLTERKTRHEIIFLLKRHTAAEVVDRIDCLEQKWGDRFQKVFKTITVDNGTEFSDCGSLQRSALDGNERTKIFYCHPYCSFERGTNEVQNRLIRRKIPKGTNFDDMTEDDIQKVEDWINDYPRAIFQYETARMQFDRELALIS